MLEFDAILFDFDGVLADTEPVHYACWAEALTAKTSVITKIDKNVDNHALRRVLGGMVKKERKKWAFSMAISFLPCF